jgi:hypothetical protein
MFKSILAIVVLIITCIFYIKMVLIILNMCVIYLDKYEKYYENNNLHN